MNENLTIDAMCQLHFPGWPARQESRWSVLMAVITKFRIVSSNFHLHFLRVVYKLTCVSTNCRLRLNWLQLPNGVPVRLRCSKPGTQNELFNFTVHWIQLYNMILINPQCYAFIYDRFYWCNQCLIILQESASALHDFRDVEQSKPLSRTGGMKHLPYLPFHFLTAPSCPCNLGRLCSRP